MKLNTAQTLYLKELLRRQGILILDDISKIDKSESNLSKEKQVLKEALNKELDLIENIRIAINTPLTLIK